MRVCVCEPISSYVCVCIYFRFFNFVKRVVDVLKVVSDVNCVDFSFFSVCVCVYNTLYSLTFAMGVCLYMGMYGPIEDTVRIRTVLKWKLVN